MRVAFRVDASGEIGLGHFKRCLALARALRAAGAEVAFVMRELGFEPGRELALAGATLLRLPPVAPSERTEPAPSAPPHAHWARTDFLTDARQTAQALQAQGADAVVVDHYSFDARWHCQVGQALGCSLVAIDDLADRPLDVRLLVDHNLAGDHRAKYAGLLPGGCTVLGGSRYALLGPGYDTAQAFEVHESVRSIGVFMGGADPQGLSAVALLACREHAGFDGPIEVVSTSANPQLEPLRAAVARWPGVVLRVDLPDLRDFYARHDLQLGAGGGATWERCCVGAPTLALIGAANQRAVVPALASIGAVATVAEADVTSPAVLGRAIAELLASPARRRELSVRARALVDGRGAERVALKMAAHTLTLRPARSCDARLLFGWRNDPATRAVSRNAQPLDFGEHEAWLQRTLADERRRLWIGQVGGIDVGAIRFDALAGGDAEVSLYLDPALHGLGLGGHLLRAGESEACCAGLAQHRYLAAVLEGNGASSRLFAAGGYIADPVAAASAGCHWFKAVGAQK